MSIRPAFIARPRLLAIAVLAATLNPAAQAFQFQSEDGAIKGAFDTTVSYGALFRTQQIDPASVGAANRGISPVGGTARTINEDDGNLNYSQGELVSSLLKATHDLDLSYKNYGFFARALYFYDDAVYNKTGLPTEARKRLAADGQMLDYYVRGSFDVAGKLDLRLGSQVVSWGESTFIPGGINVINPVDVARLRAPGSEVKEGLLPERMLWASKDITNDLSVEGFYQLEFKKTRLDPRGTFFSTNDFISPGGDRAYVGFGLRADQHLPFTALPVVDQLALDRTPDHDARNSHQFGLAFRMLVPELNNTEFGLYAINYHSRTPVVSATYGGTTAAPLSGGNVVASSTSAANGYRLSAANYFAEYVENIRLYGLSASTSGPFGIALQGEYSYRPNLPLQIAAIELLESAVGNSNNLSGLNVQGFTAANKGQYLQGYQRVSQQQLQVTGTKSFGPQFGSSQLTGVGEVGVTRLGLPSGILFGGPGTNLPATLTPTPAGPNNLAGGQVQTTGFATTVSWGYRAVVRADYPNAIGSTTLTPRLAYQHDVRGVSPTFNGGTRAATVGLTANYQQNLQADLAYTAFYGGRTDSGAYTANNAAVNGRVYNGGSYASSANPLGDRDFLSLNVSYSF